MNLSNIRTSAIIGLLAFIAGAFALVFTASAESLTRNNTTPDRRPSNDSTSVLIGFSDVTAEAGTSVTVNVELDNSVSIAGAQLNFAIDPQINVTGSSYFGRGEGFTGGASNTAWLMFDMSGLQIAAYSGVPSDLAVATLNVDLACELPAGNYSLVPTQSVISDALGNAVPSVSYGGTLTVTPSTTGCDTETNDDSADDNDSAPVLIGFSDATAEAGTSVTVNIELDNSVPIAGAQLNFAFDPQINVTGSSYFGRAAEVTATFEDLGFPMGGASNTAWLMFDLTGLQIAAYSGVPSDLAVAALNVDLACELPAGNYSLVPTQSVISDALGNAVPSVSYGGTLTVTPSTTDCGTETNDDSADDNDNTSVLIGFSDVTAEAGTSVTVNIELDNSVSIAGAQLNFAFDPQINVTGSSYFGRGEGFTGGASNTAWLIFDMSGLQIAAYSGVSSDLAVATLNVDLACELPAGNYSLVPTQSVISDALGNAVPSVSYGGTLTVTPSTTDCDTETNDDSADDNDETQITPERPSPVKPSRKGDSPGRVRLTNDHAADGNDRTQATPRHLNPEKSSRGSKDRQTQNDKTLAPTQNLGSAPDKCASPISIVGSAKGR